MVTDGRQISDEELSALVSDPSAPASSDSGSEQSFLDGADHIRPHNLVTEDTTIGINLAAIDMINERFTRHVRLGLLEVLRTSPRITSERVRTITFGEYVQTLKAPLSVNTVRMAGLRGTSLVVIDPSVIFAALDNFFGGFGRGIDGLPPGRMFTPTENRIINIMLEVIFSSIREAWAPVLDLKCEQVNSEINPQFVQIVDENDLVICCHLEVELLGKEKGSIDVVYPFSSLKPIRDELRGRVQDSEDPGSDHRKWAVDLSAAVSDAELDHKVTIGEIDLTFGELDNLCPGDIIPVRLFEDARLSADEIPLFTAEVGSSNGSTAIRIKDRYQLDKPQSEA